MQHAESLEIGANIMSRTSRPSQKLTASVTKILAAMLCLPLALLGLVGSGSITDVVRDQTKSPLPHATIPIINSLSDDITNVVPNDTDSYRVHSIHAGS